MVKKFILKIDLGNDSFRPTECVETARILRELADKLMQQQNFNSADYFMLADSNGNTVGGAEVEYGY
jgi:hypothetical protein